MRCDTPTGLSTGLHEIYLTGWYSNYSTIWIEENAINYIDVVAPIIDNVTATSVNVGSNALINVTVVDDVLDGVSNVSFTITKPNGENETFIPTTDGTHYTSVISSSSITSQIGDYDVKILANDTSGNENSAQTWFEVKSLTLHSIAGSLVDPVGQKPQGTISLYRPNTTNLISQFNIDGSYSLETHERDYDMEIKVGNAKGIARNVNLNQSLLNAFTAYGFNVTKEAYALSEYGPYSGFYFNTNTTQDYVTIAFNISDMVILEPSLVGIYRCSDSNWNYSTETQNLTKCTNFSWDRKSSTVNLVNNIVTVDVTNQSAYVLSMFICGNEKNEQGYGETNENCPVDVETGNATGDFAGTSVSTGGGGGGGSFEAEDIENLMSALEESVRPQEFETSSEKLDVIIERGSIKKPSLALINNLDINSSYNLSLTGDIREIVSLDEDEISIEKKGSAGIPLTFNADKNSAIKTYDGKLEVRSQGKLRTIDLSATVIREGEDLIEIDIDVLTEKVYPGGQLKAKVDMFNVGSIARVDLTNNYLIRDLDTGLVVANQSDNFTLEKQKQMIKLINISYNVTEGKHVFEVIARYADRSTNRKEVFEVLPIPIEGPTPLVFVLFRTIFTHWLTYLVLILGPIFYLLVRKEYKAYKKRKKERQRYVFPLDKSELPKKSENSISIGKIAETRDKAYFKMKELTMHAVAAGATGSGKTVSAQIIVEEVLNKDIPVIVFDPTFQWSGFIFPCRDKNMLELYPKFGLSEIDARAFKTNLEVIESKDEQIDIKKYLNPGELTVFGLHRLTNEELDTFVKNTINKVFTSNFETTDKLKLLIVYDEVHRLLPKYGGSEGYLSLERATREFRKWGVGVIMISQVLMDFKAAIRTNIGTEMQMRTKYAGDVKRVEAKYGPKYSATLPKLQVGTGLVQNPKYNLGKPFFVDFRPLLHDTQKITETVYQEIVKNQERIAAISDLIADRKDKGIDVSDIEIEFKLAKEKLKSGRIKIANLYFDSIEEKINE